jgi:hypothetical protein
VQNCKKGQSDISIHVMQVECHANQSKATQRVYSCRKVTSTYHSGSSEDQQESSKLPLIAFQALLGGLMMIVDRGHGHGGWLRLCS